MAMIENAHRAPFGAITTYRFVAVFYNAAEAVTSWSERRRSAAALKALNPNQLEDIGLSTADITDQSRSFVERIADWVQGRIDAFRTAQALSRLSPQLLEDIGLTEGDILRYRRDAGLY